MGAKRKSAGDVFARVLREARQEAKLTQEQLADRSDVTARFVSFLECNRQEPSFSTLLALEDGLGLPAGELVRRARRLLSNPKR